VIKQNKDMHSCNKNGKMRPVETILRKGGERIKENDGEGGFN
jgi:hypothetical protein